MLAKFQRKISWLRQMLFMLTKLMHVSKWKVFILISEQSNSFDAPFEVSYSQAGEDICFLSLLPSGIKGSYIDIGAYHPSRFSVTRRLYNHGWRGVNIDANQDLLSEFEKFRKEDVNLNFAIGQQECYELNILSKRAMSTVDNSNVRKAATLGVPVEEVRKVPGRTLRSVYDEYFPDSKCILVTLDIEGAEYDALLSMEFETLRLHRFPEWILIETSPPVSNALSLPSVELCMGFGYTAELVLPMATLLRKTS